MSKKVMNGRMKGMFKSIDAIHLEVLNLMDASQCIPESGPTQEIVERRQEIEEKLSSAVVMMMAFAHGCGIDLSTAIENKLKEITERYEAEELLNAGPSNVITPESSDESISA